MIRWLLASLMAAAIATVIPAQANATPPDAMDVSDELFGISDTHLFVLRHTDDNLGLYATSARHVFLVAVDLKTAEEQYWPVSLTVRREYFDESGGSAGMRTQREPSGADVNPHDILSERGGLPISAAALQAYPFPKGEITADATKVRVTAEFGPSFELPRALVDARITASNRNLGQRIWGPARLSRQYSTRQAWADRRVPLEQCTFGNAGSIWVSPEKPRVQLVRATCIEVEETGVTSLLLVLAPAETGAE